MHKIWITVLMSFALAAARCGPDAGGGRTWGYTGKHGPEHWAGDCAGGKSQSPIDLDEATPGRGDLALNYTTSPLELVDDGLILEARLDGRGTLKTGGVQYNLARLSFRSPAEHRHGDETHGLEAQLLHHDAAGATAMVSIFFKEGNANPLLAKIMQRLSMDRSPESPPATNTVLTIDLNDVLPATTNHVAYSGSLTTPPCSEGVSWFVMATPVEASAAQLTALHEIIGGNVRPVQPRNERPLRVSN